MDQRNVENRKYLVAYPPIPTKRFIKSEPGVGEDHDELNSGEQLDQGPLVAYPPIPRGMIKKEPLEEQECDKQTKILIAYPPIPRRRIKEESQSADTQDEFNVVEHQLISQEEGNQNPRHESTSAPFISTGTADVSTADRGNGTVQREPKKRKNITLKTAGNPPSTESDDQSDKTMPTMRSRTRRSFYLSKQGSTSMAKDDDAGKNGNNTAGSDVLGGHQSDNTMSTISSKTRSHHSNPGSTLMIRNDEGETSKQRNVTQEKGTAEERQQSAKDDERGETGEHSPLKNVDSSSSDKTSDRHSGCHLLGDKCGTTHTFSCKECGCEFKMKHHLRRHLESVHKVNPSQLAEFEAEHSTRPLNRFKCDKCMKTYKSKNNLVHHMKNECRVDPAFPCSECSYKATCKGSIRRHLIHVHNVDRSELDNFASVAALCIRPVLPFKCEKCERTYKTKNSLYNHKRVCGLDPSFSCTQCDYRTARKHHMRRHLSNVHNVEYSQLTSYGAANVMVRPQLPFKCDKCERSYKNKCHLTSHTTFECGVIPSFPCNQCGYRASQKSNLKKHIFAVHGASSSSLQA